MERNGLDARAREAADPHPENLDVDLDLDHFLQRLVTNFGAILEHLLGSDIAEAYVMQVGLALGREIEGAYRRAMGDAAKFDLDRFVQVIIDLKRRLGGNFHLLEATPARVVVEASRCPIEQLVKQAPSLCMLTSGVFGGIAAKNFGYAKVSLEQRIALGHDRCKVLIFMGPPEEVPADVLGQEYYSDETGASDKIRGQLDMASALESLRRMNDELIRFKRVAVDRELRMAELKAEIADLEARLRGAAG